MIKIHCSGLKWKTNVNLAVVEKLEKECMKYMESIVRRGEYACISQPRAVYMGRKRSKEVRMRKRVIEMLLLRRRHQPHPSTHFQMKTV